MRRDESGEGVDTTVTRFRYIAILATALMMVSGQYASAQMSPPDSPTGFPPLDQWRSAILAGDAAVLKALYSTDPPAQVNANGVVTGADADVSFWLGLKARSLQLEIVRLNERPEQFVVLVCGGPVSLHAVYLPSWGENELQSRAVVHPGG